MKAAVVEKYGPADVLHIKEVEQPRIKPDFILVRNHAASINPIDFKVRRGDLKVITGFRKPRVGILGYDVAGEVLETGEKVTGFSKGDQIYAHISVKHGGANAEYVAVPAQAASLKPANLSFEEAAAVPLAALTAMQALRDKGNIGPGEQVLINGASGGVGVFAVQIAKAFGAAVTAVCGPKNTELVQSLGADAVIDYTKEDFTKSNESFDIIFDVVANKSFPACKQALKPDGIYITTIPTPAIIASILLTSLLPGKKARSVMVKSSGKDLQILKELIEDEKVQVVIDRTFPLSQIAEAHRYSEAGHTRGKNVLIIS